MRILHIITGLMTGGAERALYNMLAAGLSAAEDTEVLSLRDEGCYGPRIRDLGISVHALGMQHGLSAAPAVVRLRRLVIKFKPSIIQGWMYHGNLAANIAEAFSHSNPAVVWNVRHSLYDLTAEKLFTQQIIRGNRCWSTRADSIIYNSSISCQQHEAFGFDSSHSVVIPNGFDLAQLKPNIEIGAAVRQKLTIPRDSLVVGHVARFHPMKDHVSFLRAAVRVANEIPLARFLLIGRNVSLENPVFAGIIPSELLNRFIFLGERQDVYRLMMAMDVFSSSSSWGEAFPNVLGEAMACGVPCVTTDVGDSADIVADTGIVVPPTDSRALARGMLAMLLKPAEERRALGSTARDRVDARYGLKTVVDQYVRLYNKLLNKVNV